MAERRELYRKNVIGNAVKGMRIATGEETEQIDSVKSAAAEHAAVRHVRAQLLSPARRT